MTIKSEHASPAGTGTTLGLVSGKRERDELANEVNEELERLSVDGEEEQGSARRKGERRAEATPVRERRVLRVLAAVSAQRLPHHVLQHMFTFLPASDVRACMRVCRHWASVLESGEGPVWRSLARRIVPEAALADPYLLAELPNHKHKLRAFKYAWNPNDASKNNYLRPNGFTIHRQPVAQSTDGVRGKLGVVSGCHAFELVWEGPLGTVAVIGIATKHAALHCPGYVALLGSDEQSWGWNLVDNTLMHNGESAGVYPRVNNPPKYQIGERIRLVIDCDSHAAFFERGGHFLGVAWEGLPPVRLFPAVCAVYGNTEVSMVYMGEAIMG